MLFHRSMQTHKESRKHRARRRPAPVFPQPSIADIDPTDPSQALDESGDFHVEPLAVDAEPSAEAADELDQAEAESFAEDDTSDEPIAEEPEKDTGELYGVHTAGAEDHERATAEDRDTFDVGENWLEALETSAAEGGPTAEHEVVIIDDSDPHEGPPPTDFRDRPKADKGSGGPGGL
jgi:hypothetical protein